MLDFRPPVTEDRKWVAPIISHAKRFGCDYSFGDMFIWQHVYNIRIASHDGFLFSINGTDDDNGIKRPTYGFPVGDGNLKEAIELIEEDSAKRGYGLEMFGLNKRQLFLYCAFNMQCLLTHLYFLRNLCSTNGTSRPTNRISSQAAFFSIYKIFEKSRRHMHNGL